jgi:hypothetical protein
MVRLELLHSARSASEFEALRGDLQALLHCPIAKARWDRALAVHEQLAKKAGLHHRAVKHPDLLIAAAEAAGSAVVHYDADYDRIAEITGQEVRGPALRGSLDRRSATAAVRHRRWDHGHAAPREQSG